MSPRRAARPCGKRGCPGLVRGDARYCAAHAHLDVRKGGDNSHYNNTRWRKLRAAFIKAHPHCEDPNGIHAQVVETKHVDHRVPVAQGGTDDWDNLQALCHSCHSRKTAVHDGGYGV